MKIRCVWEHNGDDTLLYADNFAGAFTRGHTRETAVAKMRAEVLSYLRWRGTPAPCAAAEIEIVQEKSSGIDVRDADSDVLFESERAPLTMEEYLALKSLALKSARDFHALYESIPDKNRSCLPDRKTFYGPVPRTAEEMYRHTKSVNSYYFAEIDVTADNGGTILECRERGFSALESIPDFLTLPPCAGSYGEEWSLRKVLRRFIWHDRIHAKAMFRMAQKTFPDCQIPDVFKFTP